MSKQIILPNLWLTIIKCSKTLSNWQQPSRSVLWDTFLDHSRGPCPAESALGYEARAKVNICAISFSTAVFKSHTHTHTLKCINKQRRGSCDLMCACVCVCVCTYVLIWVQVNWVLGFSQMESESFSELIQYIVGFVFHHRSYDAFVHSTMKRSWPILPTNLPCSNLFSSHTWG